MRLFLAAGALICTIAGDNTAALVFIIFLLLLEVMSDD